MASIFEDEKLRAWKEFARTIAFETLLGQLPIFPPKKKGHGKVEGLAPRAFIAMIFADRSKNRERGIEARPDEGPHIVRELIVPVQERSARVDAASDLIEKLVLGRCKSDRTGSISAMKISEACLDVGVENLLDGARLLERKEEEVGRERLAKKESRIDRHPSRKDGREDHETARDPLVFRDELAEDLGSVIVANEDRFFDAACIERLSYNAQNLASGEAFGPEEIA